MSFVKVCLEEMYDDNQEKLRYNALSTRLSKLDNDEFKKFMREIEPDSKKVKPMKVEVDHEAQMKQFLQG